MDQSTLLVSLVSFAAGFLARGSLFEGKPEAQTCHCNCQWTGPSNQEPAVNSVYPSSFSVPLWALAFVVLTILLLSNAALVFKISIKDSAGSDKEVSVGFKGKSGKGVLGVGRGLSLTG